METCGAQVQHRWNIFSVYSYQSESLCLHRTVLATSLKATGNPSIGDGDPKCLKSWRSIFVTVFHQIQVCSVTVVRILRAEIKAAEEWQLSSIRLDEAKSRPLAHQFTHLLQQTLQIFKHPCPLITEPLGVWAPVCFNKKTSMFPALKCNQGLQLQFQECKVWNPVQLCVCVYVCVRVCVKGDI